MKHTISTDKKTLTITVDKSERALLRKLTKETGIQSDNAMHVFFEPLICNSELQWIPEGTTGDLTTAPMIGITDSPRYLQDKESFPPHFGMIDCGNGEHGSEVQIILERWAFMDYQVRSVLEDLRDAGQAVFIGGGNEIAQPVNSQAEAGYRIALKRIIRAARGHVDNDAATAALETAVKEIAKAAPSVVVRGVDKWFEQAAKALEQGNNSGKSEIMLAKQADCDRLRDRAARVLKLWGVRVDYPGLYPSFNWRGGHFHSCESLLNWISKADLAGSGKHFRR